MSTTITIPGGEAVLLNSRDELTSRRRRPIELLMARVGKKLDVIQASTRLLIDGDVVLDQSDLKKPDGTPLFTGGDVEITEAQLATMMRLSDVSAWALLKSWTLDRPLPADVDEFCDLPLPIFDAIRMAAAPINAAMMAGGDPFSVDAVEDPTSPTGD